MAATSPSLLPPRAPFTMSVHNTRSRRVEPVEPLRPGHLGMYSCGPTVYAAQHIGNMRSQVVADLLRRAFTASGLQVDHVINITDVGHLVGDADEGDDKLELAASRSGETAAEIAARYTAQWATDRALLGCSEPTVLPKATDHIAEMITMVQALEDAGNTYRTDDGIYFDTSTFDHYTDLTGQDLAELETTGRVEGVEQKRNPADFALWKFSPEGVKRQQEWDSPWGVGFPGWHIECSAMSIKYLGDQFDVHTGGVDHIAVHHTNEIAQSECSLHLHPWVPYWVHHEFLKLGADKISKSSGHTLVLADLIEQGFDPLVFRFFLLQAHYRSQQDFSLDALRSAQAAYDRLRRRAADARDDAVTNGLDLDPSIAQPFRDRFWSAIADDLNTPQALAVAFEVARTADLSAAEVFALLVDFDDVLGLDLADAPSASAGDVAIDDVDSRAQELLAERQAAREARDWARADAIRDELAASGFEIIDTEDGPRVRRSRA
jgi:cysteinyl-tRNA synthetase